VVFKQSMDSGRKGSGEAGKGKRRGGLK
jgi:hypothetical protein